MRALDFDRRFARAGMVAAVVTGLALVSALTLDQFWSSDPMPLWLYLAIVGSNCCISAAYAFQAWRTRHDGAMPASPNIALASAVLSIVGLTVLAAVTGGVERTYWICHIFALIGAATALSSAATMLVALLASSSVVVSSLVAGTFTADNRGSIVFVAVLFPLVGWYLGVLTDGMRALQKQAEHDRARLDQGVQQLSEVLARAAGGDLATSVDHVAAVDGALQSLGVAFDQTLVSLRSLVGQIRQGGEQIATSAGELLATAEEHAASATQQSSAVAQTTATIEELAATAAQIAETAEAVARYAGETLTFAVQGRDAVAESVGSMDKISYRVEQIAARALSLGEKSQEIGRILELIDDLSDQTNLLALNAAIEAARAGEHGRGFAVVASEVRKLAERSMQATKDIQSIIGEIQAETNSTIIATEEGAKEVKQGTGLARGAVEALERITGMVDETTTAAKEISIATQQQRSASDQVVAAMNQVSDVSRQYASGSKQAAAAATQLNVLAAELRATVTRFKVS